MLNLRQRWRNWSATGSHPPEHNELTAHKAVARLPFPDVVHVPLSQHVGVPAIPVVRPGQEVVRGEPIASASGFLSVPMHAPATGRVREIADIPTTRGRRMPAIVIEVYPGAGQTVLYGAKRDVDTLSPDALLAAMRETGVVELGGPAIPTHVKLSTAEEASVDTVLVNCCDVEPCLTSGHRVVVEHAETMIQGLAIVRRILPAGRVIFGIDASKSEAVAALRRAIAPTDSVEIRTMEPRYPQSAEKILVHTLAGREVPSGGLPSDVGVAVFSAATLAQIGELLPNQQGLIERVITVTGNGVERPGNYLIPIGASIRHVLSGVGLKPGPARVIVGGPMMGTAIATLELPITKDMAGLLVLSGDEVAKPLSDRPCIRCGACLEACPIHLNPCRLGQLANARAYDRMVAQFHLHDCFECGCCAYVCPANIPLTQEFRIAKQMVRKRRALS